MQPDAYHTDQIAHDAVVFAGTRFGKRYLTRLQEQYEAAIKQSMRLDLTDSYRAHQATRASVLKAEMDFFETSKAIMKNPGLLKRIKDNIKRKEADAQM